MNAPRESRLLSLMSQVILIAFCLFFLVCTGLIVPPLQLGWMLLTGWFFFLRDSSREMAIPTNSLIKFGVGFVVLVLGTHWMSRWLIRAATDHESASAETMPAIRWPFRSSLLVMSGLLCSFIAAICLVGMTHEISWIASSKEPLIRYDSGRTAARRSQSRNNLKQQGLAFHNFHDQERGFPASMTLDEQGQLRQGWATELLPYLDQVNLYHSIRQNFPWTAEENRKVFQTALLVYLNPAIRYEHDPREYAPIHYAGNQNVLQPNRKRPMSEIMDGTSNTVLAGEINALYPPWGQPGNCRSLELGINQSPQGFGSPYRGGAHILMADGSVRFLTDKIDPKVLKAIATPNGGEPVAEF